MTSYLREPLLYFVMFGAALFAGDALWEKQQHKAAYTIHVSAAELDRQAEKFAAETRRVPSGDELEGLLFEVAEERVLIREAKRLGLDEGGAITGLRLAQKMRGVIQQEAEAGEPDSAVLRAWVDGNKQKFIQAETRSFEHIFFSAQSREAKARVRAEAAALIDTGVPENWNGIGDPPRASWRFQDAAQAQVTKDFGREFSRQVFTLSEGAWSGPLESDFGLHFIRVTQITPQSTPDFETVRGHAEALWRKTAARENETARLNQLINKYNIVIKQ